MLIIVIAIVVCLMLYIFYKAKFFRSKKPMEKQWISSKASICLSLFVLLFGLNQLFLYRSSVGLIVGIIFLLFGLASGWASFRKYQYYLPLAQNEVEGK